MIEAYNPLSFSTGPEITWEECDLPKEHRGDYSRMRSQWYSPLHALEMTRHYDPYDVVIKTRFDISYKIPLSAGILPVVTNGNRIFFAPYPISIGRGVYSDTVIMSRQDTMEKYLDYFHHIEHFFEDSKVLTGVPGYCSEYGASAYMISNRFWGATPAYINVEASIVRENGERIRLF